MFRFFSIFCLIAILASPVSGFDTGSFRVNPNDQVMVTLLSMVVSDLEMCRASLRPSASDYFDNVLAIGHLNNAQSALRRTDLDPAYAPLVREILDRLGKIKFYLLMNDLSKVEMRIGQLIGVIHSVLAAETGGGVLSQGTQRPGVILPNFPGIPNSGGFGIPEIPVGNGVNLPSIPN